MDLLPPLESTTRPGQGLMNWVEPYMHTDDYASQSQSNELLITVGHLLLVDKAGVVALLADDNGHLHGPSGIAQQLQCVLHGGQLLLQHLHTEMRCNYYNER